MFKVFRVRREPDDLTVIDQGYIGAESTYGHCLKTVEADRRRYEPCDYDPGAVMWSGRNAEGQYAYWYIVGEQDPS